MIINVFLLSFWFLSTLFCLQCYHGLLIDLRYHKHIWHKMHWHLLRIELNWLSRPTGFWLSKEKKQKCHLKNRHKLKNLRAQWSCAQNKESFTRFYFYFTPPNTCKLCCPLCYTTLNSKLMSAHCWQMFGCPHQARTLAWSKLSKNAKKIIQMKNYAWKEKW